MRVGIISHDGGPIPADKWAAESAAQIVDVIQIEPDSLAFDALSAQKRQFEQELADKLVKFHQDVQDSEEAKLDEHGHDILTHPISVDEDHLNAAVKAVRDVAHTKIFGNHFDKPEVIDFVRTTLGSHFATVQHIRRGWHADENPNTEQARQFRAQWHGKGD